jgi:hypothetical protein
VIPTAARRAVTDSSLPVGGYPYQTSFLVTSYASNAAVAEAKAGGGGSAFQFPFVESVFVLVCNCRMGRIIAFEKKVV